MSSSTSAMPTVLAAVSLLLVTALAVIAICLPQIELDVQPNKALFPALHCDITIYFYNRHTECPNKPPQDYRTPRDEGLFDCIEAYDRFQTALAFTVMGCIVVAAAFVTQIITRFGLSQRVPTLLALFAAICFTISWPLSWAQVTTRQCGRYLKDGHNALGYKGYDAMRGVGCNVLVATWVFSVFAFLISCLVLNKEAVARTFAYATTKSVLC